MSPRPEVRLRAVASPTDPAAAPEKMISTFDTLRDRIVTTYALLTAVELADAAAQGLAEEERT